METSLMPPATQSRLTSLNLCDLDYYERRRRLFAALRALRPGERLRLVSDHCGGDVCWLRYELEARMRQHYCWSLPADSNGVALVTVKLPGS